MIIIIPLGGVADIFKKNGYKKPKALIYLFGKPIIYYLLENLNLTNIDFVCIPYNKEYFAFNFEKQLLNDFPNIKFLFFKLATNTDGAAETLNKVLSTFEYEDTPILCLDGDNFYTIDIIEIWNGKNKVITFEDLNNKPLYSYIKFSDNRITDIIEKEKISNYACTGAYGFNSYKTLLAYTNKILQNKIKEKNEYYISVVIKEMIKDNIFFEYKLIKNDTYHCLGTPIQLKLFYNNIHKVNNLKLKKLRFCFNLDNTLVSYPKIKNDYTTVEPIKKNIQFLKYLKKNNHTIIIYTARIINVENNIDEERNELGKITFDTLEKFDIPFDEIYFGKPSADIYIDNLALNCFDNMEKELGFYMDYIEPRYFNKIESSQLNIITKKSNDLSGEIYYYKNIPSNLKHLFPLFIDYSLDNTWFKIEKINGIILSNMYLSELLKENILIDIMNSIHMLHSTQLEDKNNINIYENYSYKLKNRYKNYDYSKFAKSDILYEELLNKLTIYEKEKKGKKSVIHGDTVFTNIIINEFGQPFYIDMRGKIGNTLTIFGDEMYDWAKFYQSLIGYDSILLDKNININYQNEMILLFEKYFLSLYSKEDFENLKIITKSLLFTLIPLHDNEKCFKYYDLIDSF